MINEEYTKKSPSLIVTANSIRDKNKEPYTTHVNNLQKKEKRIKPNI